MIYLVIRPRLTSTRKSRASLSPREKERECDFIYKSSLSDGIWLTNRIYVRVLRNLPQLAQHGRHTARARVKKTLRLRAMAVCESKALPEWEIYRYSPTWSAGETFREPEFLKGLRDWTAISKASPDISNANNPRYINILKTFYKHCSRLCRYFLSQFFTTIKLYKLKFTANKSINENCIWKTQLITHTH